MVKTLTVRENGDLELPIRPRRRLRLKRRGGIGRETQSLTVPLDLGLSKLIV